MKSKQLNFFITEEDCVLINDFIKKNQGIIYSNDTLILESINSETYQLFLTHRNFIEDIVINSTPKGVKYFDIGRSYLLEFSSGGFYKNDFNSLHRGRLYYIKSYYEDSFLIEKADEFNKWCNNIFTFMKKNILNKYSLDKGYLYSASAIRWIEINSAKQTQDGLLWGKQ
jgi:hypothetical protein